MSKTRNAKLFDSTTKDEKLVKEKEDDMRKSMTVFSEETLQKNYDNISVNYEEQYLSAGFPPKICALMVSNLCL